MKHDSGCFECVNRAVKNCGVCLNHDGFKAGQSPFTPKMPIVQHCYLDVPDNAIKTRKAI